MTISRPFYSLDNFSFKGVDMMMKKVALWLRQHEI